MSTKFQKGGVLIVVIVILVIGILGLLGFVFWQNFMNTPQNTTDSTAQTTTTDKQTFVSKKLGITFQHPSDYTVKEDDSGLKEGAAKGADLHSITIDVFNQDSVQVAKITSDWQGGFVCDKNGTPIYYAYRDSVKLDVKYAPSAYYSAAIVGRDSVGYTVESGLVSTSQDDTSLVQSECSESTITYVPGIELKDAPLISTIGFYGTQNLSFKSVAEADEYLKSDAYKAVSDMIKSFNFK